MVQFNSNNKLSFEIKCLLYEWFGQKKISHLSNTEVENNRTGADWLKHISSFLDSNNIVGRDGELGFGARRGQLAGSTT